MKDYFIAIITPSLHVSTADAYKDVIPNDKRKSLKNIISLPIEQWKDALVNDFEKYWQNEDELNELDDEFSVDAPEDWNEFSLSEGDDITLDMVESGSSLEQLILLSTDKKVHIRRFYDDLVVFEVNLPPNMFIKEPHTDIIKLGWKYLEGKQLKPNYKFRPNGLPHNFDTLNELLSEKEDEFDVTAPEDWNVTELTVGDELTPDMFSDSDFPHWKWEGSDFFIQMFGNDGHKDYIRISYETKWGIRTSALMYIDKVNELVLKPEYKVVKPNNLNELLSEDEDEWDVTAPEEWNKIELGVGSIITLDMFKDVEEAKKEFQGFKKLKITRISSTNVDLQPVFWWRRINFNRVLRTLNKRLKDEYIIVNTLNESEAYFEYDIELDKTKMGVGGTKFITDSKQVNVTLADGTKSSENWYLFRIPIRTGFTNRYGGIKDFKSIRFLRMYLTGFEDSITLRFAKLDLVRNQWRQYTNIVDYSDQYTPLTDVTGLNTLAVSVEENSSRLPINYIIPPGIERVQLLSNNGVNLLQNEQALSLQLKGLKPAGRAGASPRGVFKTMNVDIRRYGKLSMFLHAENVLNSLTKINDGDLTAVIRLGQDFQNNFNKKIISHLKQNLK